MCIELEDIAGMEMPCKCECGKWFDLNDGNGCGGLGCNVVMCCECIPRPWELCPRCQRRED